MKCFVIAMEKEAQPFIDKMDVLSDVVINGKRTVRGELGGEMCAVVVCGVGKANAASGAQYCADLLGADVIINAGVAGGLSKDLAVGNIYGVSEVVQYDFDLCRINNTEIGTLNEFDKNYLALSVSDVFPAKRLGTGDRFDDRESDFLLLTNTLKADMRDMECGAIAQVCAHAGVRCYSFKAISDIAGSGSTTEQYYENLSLCLAALSENAEKILFASV